MLASRGCWKAWVPLLAWLAATSACRAEDAAAPRDRPSSAPEATAGNCASPGEDFAGALSRPHWNGWGASPEQRRYQNAAMAGLAAEDVPRLKLKWAFGFAGATRAYAQPTVVAGRVFVGSAGGEVYSLDAATGCTHWVFKAAGPVRTAVSVGDGPRGWLVHFGDQRGNAYAVDALTGRAVWTTQVDPHPLALITGAPTLVAGVLYVPVSSSEEAAAALPDYPCCSFRGSVVALQADTGRRLWQAFSIASPAAPVRTEEQGALHMGPAGAAIWSAPTVDRQAGRVVATTGDSYTDPPSDSADAFIAWRRDDGARAWTHQLTAGDSYNVACNYQAPGVGNCPLASGPDEDFGTSPMLVSLGGGRRALIAGQKSGVVHALDPDHDGALLWQTRVGKGGKLGGVQWGLAADERQAYVAVSDVRILVAPADAPGARPSLSGLSMRFDPEVGGGLLALNLATGAVVWRTPHPGCGGMPGCSPAQSAAVTAIPGIVFSGGLDGHLRAYAADSGRIVWDLDTQRPYTTVNEVAAHGGSIDGPGPVVVGGMLFIDSGYGFYGGAPGNVLLALTVGGR
jgi:polyvinyl alcohol dehydrogenase (cytochrome)